MPVWWLAPKDNVHAAPPCWQIQAAKALPHAKDSPPPEPPPNSTSWRRLALMAHELQCGHTGLPMDQ